MIPAKVLGFSEIQSLIQAEVAVYSEVLQATPQIPAPTASLLDVKPPTQCPLHYLGRKLGKEPDTVELKMATGDDISVGALLVITKRRKRNYTTDYKIEKDMDVGKQTTSLDEV